MNIFAIKQKNRIFTYTLPIAICLVLSPLYPKQLQAKENFEPVTVKTRPRPLYDPIGIRLSSFKVFPKLALSEYFDDNILFDDADERSDFVTSIRPQLAIKSDWNRHALFLSSSANILQHISNDNENTEDFNFNGNGRLDILRNSRLTAGAGYAQNHKIRSSPDDVLGLEPTVFHQITAFSAIEHELNQFTLKAGVNYMDKDFDDVDGSTGIINNDDRDRDKISGEFRLSYEVSPQYAAFVQGGINKIDYENLSDNLALDRGSEGYDVSIGSQFYGSEVLFGELYVGYKEQFYEDPRLISIDGLTGGGSVTWQPSGLTTFNITSSRSILETTIENASGVFQTKARIEIDHELLRNFLLNFNLTVFENEYKGIDRKDEHLNVGVGAKYFFNPLVNLGIKYDFLTRDSNINTSDYTRNAVFLNINIHL